MPSRAARALGGELLGGRGDDVVAPVSRDQRRREQCRLQLDLFLSSKSASLFESHPEVPRKAGPTEMETARIKRSVGHDISRRGLMVRDASLPAVARGLLGGALRLGGRIVAGA
jgi:hypothetical protein